MIEAFDLYLEWIDMDQDDLNKPTYGASSHYLSNAGDAYFTEKRTFGQLSAAWNLPLWLPYITPHDSVLDFGCGGGYLLNLLPARKKVGVDINPAARSQAQSLGLSVYPTMDDLPPERYTRIISSHALEHVPHPLIVLQSIQRFLDPHGLLLLLLPLDDWRNKSNRQYHNDDSDHHLYTWTPQTIGNLLKEAGYEIKCIKIVSDAMPVNTLMVRLAQRYTFSRRFLGWAMSVVLLRRQVFGVAYHTPS